MRMKHAVDFKYYDYQTENRTVDKDPRPVEILENVINPGFDDDGRMLTHPLPPQYPRFTQPDRQLSESAYVKSSKIMYPHLHTSSVPKHQQVRTIMAKAKCPAEDAMIIANECISLNATAQMVDKFCDWAKAKGSDKLITYLEPFVEAVVDVETSFQEVEPWEENPVEAGMPMWGNTLNNIRGYNGICEDVPVETIKCPKKEPGMAQIIGNKIVWPTSLLDMSPIPEPEVITAEDIFTAPNPETSDEEEPEDWEAQTAEWEPEERNPNLGTTIGYHVLEDLGVKQEKINELIGLKKNPLSDFDLPWTILMDLQYQSLELVEDLWNKWLSWDARQPDWFKAAIEKSSSFTDYHELMQWRREIFENAGFNDHKFNKAQAGAFWTACNSHKAQLTPKHLGISARGILKRIIQANGNLGWVGQWLYKVGSGETKVYPKPTDYEMSVIWQTFKRQKEVHITA